MCNGGSQSDYEEKKTSKITDVEVRVLYVLKLLRV
jgi:hypothetical protein